MTKCYLAGPMRGHVVEVAMDWRFDLAEDLKTLGYSALVPGMAEGVHKMHPAEVLEMSTIQTVGEQIVNVDFHLVQISDYLVANLSYANKMPTGTLAEISWAFAMDIPVIVVGDNEYTKEPFIATQATLCVSTVEEVIPAITTLEGVWN